MIAKGKSRVTNGARPIEGANFVGRRGRRYRDILDNLISEYGCISEADLARARATATLALAIEDEAARLIRGEETDASLAARYATRLQRALADLAASKYARRRAVR